MARLTRFLRREKTNARVIPASTPFDAPGVFMPQYGKSHFLVSGTGKPGTDIVPGNPSYNPVVPGSVTGYNPVVNGNISGYNPVVPGNPYTNNPTYTPGNAVPASYSPGNTDYNPDTYTPGNYVPPATYPGTPYTNPSTYTPGTSGTNPDTYTPGNTVPGSSDYTTTPKNSSCPSGWSYNGYYISPDPNPTYGVPDDYRECTISNPPTTNPPTLVPGNPYTNNPTYTPGNTIVGPSYTVPGYNNPGTYDPGNAYTNPGTYTAAYSNPDTYTPGASGTNPSTGGNANYNPSTGGNANYNPPTGGNPITNPSTPGNLAGYNPGNPGNTDYNAPYISSWTMTTYIKDEGPGTNGPDEIDETTNTSYGSGPHPPGGSNYSTSPYSNSPPGTNPYSQYLQFSYADGPTVPGNAYTNPSNGGNPIYNPPTPGNPVYNPPTANGPSQPFTVLGVTFPGAPGGSPGNYVADTLVKVTYSTDGTSINVPPGAQVVVKQQF